MRLINNKITLVFIWTKINSSRFGHSSI
jgi:hypothetical protein